jgi:hypothetical protein
LSRHTKAAAPADATRRPSRRKRTLGELLELLYRSHERINSLHAEFREWTRDSRRGPAGESVEVVNINGRLSWRGPAPWPRAAESRRLIWLQKPDRVRIEILQNQTLGRVGVRAGAEWWRWDRMEGVSSGSTALTHGERIMPPMLDPPLLAPARLIAGLLLKPIGTGVRVGRDVVRVSAKPREPPDSRGELSYELEFDLEHGTLLRRAMFENSECFEITEAIAIEYDIEIEPERFCFGAPPGVATTAPSGS